MFQRQYFSLPVIVVLHIMNYVIYVKEIVVQLAIWMYLLIFQELLLTSVKHMFSID